MKETQHPLVTRIHSAALKLFANQGQPEVNISELAQVAGISRGSIYNHIPSPETLFETIAVQLANDMHERVTASFAPSMDPAQRLANGIRYFVQRAHKEPQWGRFLCRFALSQDALQSMWAGPTMHDVIDGLNQQIYTFRPDQLPSAGALIAGTTLTSMFLVLEGHQAWRTAGMDAAELVLRGLGVDPDQSRRYAAGSLPPLKDSVSPGQS